MLRIARISRAFRWLALPLALGVTHVAFESEADAQTATSKKKKKKGKKKKGPSMDDSAGQDVEAGGFAPGTKDSTTTQVEVVEEPEKKKPKPGETAAEEVTLEEVDEAPPESAEPEGPPSPFSLNWLSLTIQQNVLIYPNQPNVCPAVNDAGQPVNGAGGYSCRDADSLHKGAVYAGAGNEVQGGFGLADLRFMLGYDRVLVGKLTLGARFGVAILQSPALRGTKAPMPFHGEGKIAYYFGDSPFERKGIRPYVGFAVGIAQIHGKVSVTYYKDRIGYQNNKPGRVDVWRTTGPGFLALSGGFAYPFGDFALNVELRLQQTLGTPAIAPALAVGLAYGL
jgi:hypothetical protein